MHILFTTFNFYFLNNKYNLYIFFGSKNNLLDYRCEKKEACQKLFDTEGIILAILSESWELEFFG